MKEKKMNVTKYGKYLYIFGIVLFLITLLSMNFDKDFEIRSSSYIVIPRNLHILSMISISMFFVGVLIKLNIQVRREIPFILILLGVYLFWMGGIENSSSMYNIKDGYKFLTTTTINNYIIQILGLCMFFIGLIQTRKN